MIELRQVSRVYGDAVALRDVSLVAGPGVVTVLGHNGAGKSTLLRLLAGIDRPTTGTVRVLGRDPSAPGIRRRIGCALAGGPAFADLVPHEHVGLVSRAGTTAVAEALDRLGISGERPVGARSTGERQRVHLAAAIAHRPAVLLLDEPLTGLDERWRTEAVELLADLGAAGCCVIATAHDHGALAAARPRVLTLRAGELVDGNPASMAVRTTDAVALGGALMTAGVARSVDLRGPDLLVVHTDDAAALGRTIVRVADAVGCEVRALTPRALEPRP